LFEWLCSFQIVILSREDDEGFLDLCLNLRRAQHDRSGGF
jgi:hypothetical protein